MDVKLIGDTTYGKPVGFFPIPIFNYDIYPISFKTVNSAGNADYYTGFAPDKLVSDGVNKNWGDVNEPSLAAALRYISTGSFDRFAAESQALQLRAMTETKSVNKRSMKINFPECSLKRNRSMDSKREMAGRLAIFFILF